MDALTLLDLVYITVIIFLLVVGALLSIVLIKVQKILTPMIETVNQIQTFKQKAGIVSNVVVNKLSNAFTKKRKK